MDKKQQIIDLWRTCFGDSEAFISLYFERVYTDQNAMAIERDGKIVCALQMLPYTMTYQGSEVQVSYIYGACTDPQYRAQGLMPQLLKDSFREMEKRGIAFTILIPAEPWLFDYYRKLGYTEAFFYAEEVYTLPAPPLHLPGIRVSRPENPFSNELYAYFDRKLRERPTCILHTYANFVIIVEDLRLLEGEIFVASNADNKIVGLAFVVPDEEESPSSTKKTCIKELLFDSQEVKDQLCLEACMWQGTSQAIVKRPPSSSSHAIPLGMARAIHANPMEGMGYMGLVQD